MIPLDFAGPRLTAALQEQPSLTLEFYSYGVLLRKRDGDAVTEYPVDPEQIALALAAKVIFDTGLLTEETLLVRQDGVKRVVVEFRRAQKTGLFLEGSDAPLRVPLPPLLLIRTTTENKNPQYQVYAVKARPTKLDTPLFHAPLPNVFHSGSICWGSVRRVEDAALQSNSLAADWITLLGSPFGDHGVSGKSTSHPHDIRQKL
ncbi:MAG: prokaryotic E2 ligase family D protein, partial [Anaerolineae bacterium]|nr:prokaryotic E2 ligase family D protein [Anaerolineae bacterium]